MNEISGAILVQNPLDDAYRSLPPLGTAEYLSYLRTAPTEDLPPEVLARAYRKLADSGDEEACRATLARLLGEKGGRPEYMLPLLLLAAQRVPPHQHWQEALDVYQDAIALILEVLPTEQGRFAERAWVSFCRQRLTDAWRKRHGRRGERTEPARFEPLSGAAGEAQDPFDRPFDPPPWHGTVEPDKLPWLEGFVRRTLARIPDAVIRGVAEDQWLSDGPSPIAATGKSSNGVKPLTERFAKSRFQIYRALNAARAYVFAALETQNEMEIDLDLFRGRFGPPQG